jgi:hypothetical protein
MSLYIPVLKKMKYSDQMTIDRVLPASGELVVKKGDKVVPFTKVGRTKLSKEYFELPDKIKLGENSDENSFVYENEKIGKVGFKSILAPYNGFISYINDKPHFFQEKKDVWLLSGAWGQVSEVLSGTSATIQTQTVDINFIAYTQKYLMGELIVFPNPNELLDIEYMKNFSNNVQDKIIYVGHHIRKEVYDMAVELKVGGIVGGSIEKSLYSYAKNQSTAVAITTGFGNYSTPVHIFEFLKTISNRHVFFDGENGYLRVPVPSDNRFTVSATNSSLRVVKKGLSVLIFDKKNFGLTGDVEDVQGTKVYVKLNKSGETVDTEVPNLFALI